LFPLSFTDRTEKDRVARDIIEQIINGVQRALAEDGEGDSVVSREIHTYREKQAKADREKQERKEEFVRKWKDQEGRRRKTRNTP